VGSLLHHLRSGGSVGLLLDLWVKDARSVAFFGQPMRAPLTPARMAERYGGDIVPVHTQRVGAARFRVTAYAPLVFDAAAADEETRAICITQQLIELMEQWIRE
jgi:KDO2-lipid IV(A) lauroyltransferase